MEFTQESYSRWYIVQALFKLMSEYEYEKINVTDIVGKAGVGRATFYRYFKRKEDIIIYYFEHYTKEFVFNQTFFPRCKEDHMKIIQEILTVFKKHMEQFKLIQTARLEYIYLDYLNKNFVATFEKDYPNHNKYTPYLYAGMLFNISMKWLSSDCDEPIEILTQSIVDAIYS